MTESSRVRVICRRDIDNNKKKKEERYLSRSIPYIIPIAKDGEKYMTGQDLKYKEIVDGRSAGRIEVLPLTEEEQKKYPFVINPGVLYKVRHLQWLSKKDDYQNAIINLLIASGKWTMGKSEFDENPMRYDGYLEDPETEAVASNVFKDIRYEAETCIRTSSADYIPRVVMMLNFLDPNININLTLSDELIKESLFEVCDTKPEIVKKCFPRYNKGVEKDMFLLECLHYDILSKRDNGDVYYQNDYVGKTIEDIKRYLGKKDHEQLYSKFQAQMDFKKGKSVPQVSSTGENDDVVLIMECKSAIFDKDYDKAKLVHSKINKDKFKHEYDMLAENIEAMKEKRNESKNDVVKEKFIEELKGLQLIDIQKKISNKLSKYKEEECKSFWNDKEKLIDYMVSIKFTK